jgi:hypothetical protein
MRGAVADMARLAAELLLPQLLSGVNSQQLLAAAFLYAPAANA